MTRRGWCPTLHEPMESGDGLLLRVKPPAGRISAAQARLLSAQAARHGNGVIDLTQRGNLQPRGFSAASACAFAHAMVEAGLAHPDPAVERGRNLLAPPLLGWDSTIALGTAELVRGLGQAMAGWPALPHKFGVVVDGGGLVPLASENADLRLACRAGRVEIRLGGGDALALCLPADAVEAVTRLVRGVAALAPMERMAQAVARTGAAAILSAAGLTPRVDEGALPAPPSVAGLLPARVLGAVAPFGQLTMTQLQGLADLAEQHGDGTLRLTPWRAVLLPGVASAEAAGALGLIVEGADPRLRIVACPGRPGCGAALADTHLAAAWLAPRLPPGLGLLHISGCAKGCAHPRGAPATLVGARGGFTLIRGGRAADRPETSPMTLEQTLAVLDPT